MIGQVFNHGYVPGYRKTISQALKVSGYATGHFGKWHLNSRGPEFQFQFIPNGPKDFGFERDSYKLFRS